MVHLLYYCYCSRYTYRLHPSHFPLYTYWHPMNGVHFNQALSIYRSTSTPHSGTPQTVMVDGLGRGMLDKLWLSHGHVTITHPD